MMKKMEGGGPGGDKGIVGLHKYCVEDGWVVGKYDDGL